MARAKPCTIFHKLVRSAKIHIQSNDIIVTPPRRANSPYLLAAGYMEAAEPIPWLQYRKLCLHLAAIPEALPTSRMN